MDLFIVYDTFNHKVINIYDDYDNAVLERDNLNEQRVSNDIIINESYLITSEHNKNSSEFNEQDYYDMKNKVNTLEGDLEDAKYKYNILVDEYINDAYHTSLLMIIFAIVMCLILYLYPKHINIFHKYFEWF